MYGDVIWYHPELRVALIERQDGFTVGTVEHGTLERNQRVQGDLRTAGQTTLTVVPQGNEVIFTVEADALTEDQANELLGFIRD
jgi:hypothetical protein